MFELFSLSEHPVPPNATLVKVNYNSQQRNEVELEWKVQNETNGGWTSFILEHKWVSERPGRRSNDSKKATERIPAPDWYSTIIQDPEARSHTVGKLTPTFTYQFRITPVNYRTVGHPSAARTPGIVREEGDKAWSDTESWAKTGAWVRAGLTNRSNRCNK